MALAAPLSTPATQGHIMCRRLAVASRAPALGATGCRMPVSPIDSTPCPRPACVGRGGALWLHGLPSLSSKSSSATTRRPAVGLQSGIELYQAAELDHMHVRASLASKQPRAEGTHSKHLKRCAHAGTAAASSSARSSGSSSAAPAPAAASRYAWRLAVCEEGGAEAGQALRSVRREHGPTSQFPRGEALADDTQEQTIGGRPLRRPPTREVLPPAARRRLISSSSSALLSSATLPSESGMRGPEAMAGRLRAPVGSLRN